jgi:hypothetical protein
VINKYENTFKEIKGVNNICLEEDADFKRSLYEKERKIAGIQKTNIKEKNKYSDSLQQMTMSKITYI